ncbi:LacI family DNA-binding transcriptional regulator [Halothermothrix orenii]|uniref:Transcriptional regulator, LacI family n=1 Tax=Halothermothrix orenii (strain H 168 / OCM 544 / DSM 9562) TaxID=373903 RepID=B8D1Y8_HALOH|nr:LacI family DNA-binding transcriptional regulator [Halothermothrix orenii]ACL69215.1 transcriptional regulator, LacI family [Halothermothrix orenii H 168]
MPVTIKDIAKKANVSVTTVSRVLNNKPDVSEKTKSKILKIINELGYNPNGVARGLVLNRTHTIGLIIPDIRNPFFPEVARGIEDKAKEYGYSVIYCNTDNKKEEEKKAVELLLNKRVDGIILSLSMNNRDELDRIKKQGCPIVQIDRKVPDANYPTVTIDNLISAYNATKHLINLGHKYIAHITGNLDTKTGQDRLNGYKKAMHERGIHISQEWIIEGDYSKESGYKNMKRILNLKNRPTGIFIANDLMAIGAYKAVFESKLNIPEDISIIGHDDIELASLVNPELTTMAQPKYEMGKHAARLLIQEIEGSDQDNNQNILLNTELVVRGSTGGVG